MFCGKHGFSISILVYLTLNGVINLATLATLNFRQSKLAKIVPVPCWIIKELATGTTWLKGVTTWPNILLIVGGYHN